MLLSDKNARARRKSWSRGASIGGGYTLNTRTRGQDKGLMYRIGAIVMLLVVVVGAFFAACKGVEFAWGLLFARNDRFAITNIEVVGGRFKTEAMIREYFAYEGISEGTNLLAFSIRDFREAYLERNPLVKSISISRHLPDTLRVVVREREPLARLGQRGTLVTDSNGFVFRLSSNLHRLPVIRGCKDPRIKPGAFVSGRAMAAVEVLALCDRASMQLRVVGVDVAKKDYLVLHVLTAGGHMTEAKLSWDGMDARNDNSQANLLRQLNCLRAAALESAGRRSTLDVTFRDKIYGQ